VTEIYDKAKWHSDGEYPAELSPDQAYVYTGMFLAWAVHRGIEGEGIPVRLADAVKRRKITGATAYARLGGVLTRDVLSVVGQRFADAYYATGRFANDYAKVLAARLPTIYHVKDSWAHYDRLVLRLDARFDTWSKKSGPKRAASKNTSASRAAVRLKRLRARAKNSDVEVEHLLAFASLGDARAVAALRAIAAEHGWSTWGTKRDRRVPLGCWTDTVCAFLEGGYERLVELALDPKTKHSFALAVLEHCETMESALAVLAIVEAVERRAKPDRARLRDCVDALNLLLCFGKVSLRGKDEARARHFLHRRLANKLPITQRAGVILALRGCGNADSIALLANYSLPSPWTNVVNLTTRAIQNRRKLQRRP